MRVEPLPPRAADQLPAFAPPAAQVTSSTRSGGVNPNSPTDPLPPRGKRCHHGVRGRFVVLWCVSLARVRLVLLLVALVVAVGCTTVVPGEAVVPSGVLLPPRPREIRLDGVDPCSLLTPEQRTALGLDSEPRSSNPFVGMYRRDVPTCTVRGPYPETVLLVSGTVTSVGIERWLAGDIAADVRSTTVAGFPAVIAVPRRFSDYCDVAVDVAAGQLLDVQFGGGGPRALIPQEELCRRALRSAELIMSSLLAR
jgi:hypothetical protein